MPELNWITLSFPNSPDIEVLTHLADLGLNQIIDVTTKKDANILDLNFLSLEKPILHSIPKSFSRSLSCGFSDTTINIQRASSCEKKLLQILFQTSCFQRKQ